MKRCTDNISAVCFLTCHRVLFINRHQYSFFFFPGSLGLIALEEFDARQIFSTVGSFFFTKNAAAIFLLRKKTGQK
jgi:hypothetical protein